MILTTQIPSPTESSQKRAKAPIELIALIYFFLLTCSETVTGNLLIFRSCYAIHGYNESECELLGTQNSDNITSELEKISEPDANDIATVRRFSNGIINGIVCIFVGTWSDKYGRKPLMITGLVGYLIQYALEALYSLFTDLSPWYLILCDIPVLLTGGPFGFLALVSSYIMDTTPAENRGLKLSILGVTANIGPCLANLIISYLFDAVGYTWVYAICSLISLATVLLIVFFVPESLELEKKEKFTKSILKLFRTDTFKEMARTAIKARPNYGRFMILIATIIGAVGATTLVGQLSMLPFYLRAKFNWSLRHLSLYNSGSTLVSGFATIASSVILQKLLKLPETAMMLFSLVMTVFAHVLLGLATTDAHIYIATVLNSCASLVMPMLRSLCAKSIPMDEMGKVFSMFTSFDSVLALCASSIYTAVYNLTIDTDPGLFNFLTVGLTSVSILLVIWIAIIYHFKIQKNEKQTTEKIETPKVEIEVIKT